MPLAAVTLARHSRSIPMHRAFRSSLTHSRPLASVAALVVAAVALGLGTFAYRYLSFAGADDSSAPWEQAGLRRSNGSRTRSADQPAHVNVAALADRVMQQIDDRLHAWRERTGF